MSFFDGIEEAPVSEGGIYIQPGNYVSEILKLKAGESRKKLKFFVAEMKVLQSDNPAQPPGTYVSWLQMFHWDGSLGRIKQFCAAACTAMTPDNPTDVKDINAEGMDMLCSDVNPLKGTKIGYNATQTTSKSDKIVTQTKFYPPTN